MNLKSSLSLPVAGLLAATCLWAPGGRAWADDAQVLAQADGFLRTHRLDQASQALGSDERLALGRALSTPRRRLSDEAVAGLLRNPTAWSTRGAEGRGLLRTIVKSLPRVASVPGINHTLKLAANDNPANFRGYGVEVIAAAALAGYRTETGEQGRMTRMGADILGIDGRLRESDGAVLIGADKVERLVTVKSLSSLNSMHKTLSKAADQLALRNLQQNGARRPGVMVIGYGSAEVWGKLQTKDWQASANRTGAKLLVIAINQATGRTTKLAAFEPDPNSTIKPKVPRARRHVAGDATRWRATRNSWLGQRGPGVNHLHLGQRWGGSRLPALRLRPTSR